MNEYRHPLDAQRGIGRYFAHYNRTRVHQALDYRTPAVVYFGWPGGDLTTIKSISIN